jgi:hypothetical protein
LRLARKISWKTGVFRGFAGCDACVSAAIGEQISVVGDDSLWRLLQIWAAAPV